MASSSEKYPTVICTSVTSTGTIIGGTPGTDTANITFSGCTVEVLKKALTSTQCLVKGGPSLSTGEVKVEAITELVYKEEAENTHVYDLFSPTSAHKPVFTKLEFVVGTGSCGSVPSGLVPVEGSVAAEASPINEDSPTGKLVFPTTAIKSAFQWLGGGKYMEVKPSLKLYGGLATGTQSGTEDVMIENNEAWGIFTP